MEPRRCFARTLLIGLVCAHAPAQRTWTVSLHGGADFYEIQPAIAAAAPGDRIEVRLALTYAPFDVYKGVDLEATDGAMVPTFSVSGVAAHETARVAGFVVVPPATYPRAQVLACAGPVILANVTVQRGAPNFGGLEHAAVDVSDSAAVVLLDCTADGQAGSTSGAAVGMRVVRSAITVQRSTVRGGPGGATATAGGSGGAGISASASSVILSECTVLGGNGNFGTIAGGSGGAAVSLDDSTGWASASVLTGGAAGAGGSFHGVPGDGVHGAMRVGEDCMVSGGAAIGGGTGLALTGGAVGIPATTFLQAPVEAGLGKTVSFAWTGPPDTGVLALAAARPGHLAVAGFEGVFLLDPTTVVPWTVFGLPMSGANTSTLSIPRNPALREHDVFVQGVAIEPGGRLTLTGLGDLRVR